MRNLCYMVSRREKLSRSYFRLREQTFHKQVAVMSCGVSYVDSVSAAELNAIRQANRGANIYDATYSAVESSKSKEDFEKIVQLIGKLGAGSSSSSSIAATAQGSRKVLIELQFLKIIDWV